MVTDFRFPRKLLCACLARAARPPLRTALPQPPRSALRLRAQLSIGDRQCESQDGTWRVFHTDSACLGCHAGGFAERRLAGPVPSGQAPGLKPSGMWDLGVLSLIMWPRASVSGILARRCWPRDTAPRVPSDAGILVRLPALRTSCRWTRPAWKGRSTGSPPGSWCHRPGVSTFKTCSAVSK